MTADKEKRHLEITKGVNATHQEIYDRVKKYKQLISGHALGEQKEPIIWFTYFSNGKSGRNNTQLKVHLGNIDEYRFLGYGHGHDSHELVYSVGVGDYQDLIRELNSESVQKIEQYIYKEAYELYGRKFKE